MAHDNKVVQSFNLDGGSRCVDVFLRPDGSFGFEEYRREAEDLRGVVSDRLPQRSQVCDGRRCAPAREADDRLACGSSRRSLRKRSSPMWTRPRRSA